MGIPNHFKKYTDNLISMLISFQCRFGISYYKYMMSIFLNFHKKSAHHNYKIKSEKITIIEFNKENKKNQILP